MDVEPYVLRYWETEFPEIKPIRSKSGQRMYRRVDVEKLVVIKRLLYDERYTIEGAREHLKGAVEETRPTKREGTQDTKGLLLKLKDELESCLNEFRKT